MEIKEIKNYLEKLSIEEIHDIDNFIKTIIKIKQVGNVPIEETFKFFNEEYIVKNEHPISSCKACAFYNKAYNQSCKYLCCSYKCRDDKQNVIFVKKENNND